MAARPPRLIDLLGSVRSPVDPQAVTRILEATNYPGNAWLLMLWLGFIQEICRRREVLQALEDLDRNPKLRALQHLFGPDDLLGTLEVTHDSLKDWTVDFISSQFLAGIYEQIFNRPKSYSEDGPSIRFIQAVLKEIGIERSRDSIRSGVKRHLEKKRKAEEQGKAREERGGANEG